MSHPHPTPEIAAALAPPAPRGRRPHRVVVVGGGFGGLRAVRGLADGPVEVTLIDRRNFHLFQPLLYQVATGALSAGEIATPLRAILKRQDNARVVMGEVLGIDLEARRLSVGAVGDGAGREIEYDTLVVAAGAGHSYFGHDEWRAAAPGLKSLEDALEIRRRVLLAFEAAEAEDDPALRRAWLTFVVVGGRPDRRRAGRADRRDRPRDAAPRLPRHRPGGRPRAAGGGRRPAAAPASTRSCRSRRAARSSGSA